MGGLPHSIFASAALPLRVREMAGIGVGTCSLDTVSVFCSSSGDFGYFNFLLKTICNFSHLSPKISLLP